MSDQEDRSGQGEGRLAQPASDVPEEERARGYLKDRYGSGAEVITGFSGVVYEHEDSAARIWLLSSVVWFIVVTTFGIIIATELAIPEMFHGIPWLVFSRVRPCHVEGVIFAWLTTMYWGAILYFSPVCWGHAGSGARTGLTGRRGSTTSP